MKIKAYADKKCYVKPSYINLGDSILVKRPFTMSKGSTVYNPNPMTVVKTSMITAKNADASVTRNSSFFKKLTFQEINPPHVEEYTEESQIPVSFSKVNLPTISERQTPPAQEVSKSPPQENSSNKDIQNGPVEIPTVIPETEQPPPLRRSTRRQIPRKILDL
ncbi:Hypothetical predicted protein [Paramuricea clavata]|uniref:Uncharacterized protein n=1 Tax=Paramuricea clavata TaxID=317549 RepID=A0A7D9KB72_PARCT|nr:Hypothetical predicted protein [Paramuricea clavata]